MTTQEALRVLIAHKEQQHKPTQKEQKMLNLRLDGKNHEIAALTLEADENGVTVVASTVADPEPAPPPAPDPEPTPPVPDPTPPVPDPGCTAPPGVRVIPAGWPIHRRETIRLRAGEIQSFPFVPQYGQAGGFETVPTSANNATRRMWVSECPGGDPVSARASSNGFALTNIQWATYAARAVVQLIPGRQYYVNLSVDEDSTCYAAGSLS